MGNANACGSGYEYSISPNTNSFLTFTSPTLTGQTNNFADVGSYTINLTIKLYPYHIRTNSFVVKVECILQAPVCTTTSVTVEIGIDIQPFDIPFTQPQSCGVSATLTSNPSGQEFWLSLSSNTASGGNIQINTATLSQVRTYSLTLINTYET